MKSESVVSEKKKNYQYNYAAGRSQMYDKRSREEKGRRIIQLLAHRYGREKLKQFSLMDIGGSSGIIDAVLAQHVKEVVCIDIDKGAVDFARKNFKRKNLKFIIDDALKLSFKDNRFDVIVCTHVYEHVSDQKKLFSEMYRVLKPGGCCYLAATNRLWIFEAHYNLLFLSWLPKSLSHAYVRLFRKANKYYETPRTYWTLKKLSKKFQVIEFTESIVRNPSLYGYHTSIVSSRPLRYIFWLIAPFARYFSPTFIWLLCKKK